MALFLLQPIIPKSIAGAEDFDDFEADDWRKDMTQVIQHRIDQGEYTHNAILDRLTKFAKDKWPPNSFHLLSTFQKLQDSSAYGLNQLEFVSLLQRELAPSHDAEMKLDLGLQILFRMFKHFSAFPFESSSTEYLDVDGLIRAHYILRHYHGGWTLSHDLGPYNGFLLGNEKPTRTDRNRMFFRSFATPMAANHVSNNDKRFRKVPIPHFEYSISDKSTEIPFNERFESVINIQIHKHEDERRVDLSDVVEWSYSFQDEIFPVNRPRSSYLPIFEQDLPFYKYYLDELMITSSDFRELLKVFLVVAFRPTGKFLNLAKFDEMFTFLPNTEIMNWETFDELMAEKVRMFSYFGIF
jgi:hypothetical protein